MNYVLAPILTGLEKDRTEFFSKGRQTPFMSFPFSKRIQNSQGNTPECTVFSFAEILENKIFYETGEWYKMEISETQKVWNEMKHMGLASEKYGAYINAPIVAMEGKEVTLKNIEDDKTITVKIKNWFTVGNKLENDFLDQVKREIAYGGGVLTGLNNRLSKLDYYKAKDYPFIVQKNNDAQNIAHAINLTEFDDTADRGNLKKGLIASSGSWGDKFGDQGVVYFEKDQIHNLFQPVGFSLTYLS